MERGDGVPTNYHSLRRTRSQNHVIEGVGSNQVSVVAITDADELLAAHGSLVSVIDPASAKLLTTLDAGGSISGLWASPKGSFAYAAHHLGGAARIDVDLPQAPTATVTRIAGADRYATATSISQTCFPSGADVVYLASGATFPDALSAASAAALADASLLLTAPGTLLPVVRDEIVRLTPERMVAIGGSTS